MLLPSTRDLSVFSEPAKSTKNNLPARIVEFYLFYCLMPIIRIKCERDER